MYARLTDQDNIFARIRISDLVNFGSFLPGPEIFTGSRSATMIMRSKTKQMPYLPFSSNFSPAATAILNICYVFLQSNILSGQIVEGIS